MGLRLIMAEVSEAAPFIVRPLADPLYRDLAWGWIPRLIDAGHLRQAARQARFDPIMGRELPNPIDMYSTLPKGYWRLRNVTDESKHPLYMPFKIEEDRGHGTGLFPVSFRSVGTASVQLRREGDLTGMIELSYWHGQLEDSAEE